MSYVSKINLYGTDYTIKDSTAQSTAENANSTAQNANSLANSNSSKIETLSTETVIISYETETESINVTKGINLS